MKTLKSVAESLGKSIVESGGDVDDKLLLKIKHELKCFKASGDLLTVSGYMGYRAYFGKPRRYSDKVTLEEVDGLLIEEGFLPESLIEDLEFPIKKEGIKLYVFKDLLVGATFGTEYFSFPQEFVSYEDSSLSLEGDFSSVGDLPPDLFRLTTGDRLNNGVVSIGQALNRHIIFLVTFTLAITLVSAHFLNPIMLGVVPTLFMFIIGPLVEYSNRNHEVIKDINDPLCLLEVLNTDICNKELKTQASLDALQDKRARLMASQKVLIGEDAYAVTITNTLHEVGDELDKAKKFLRDLKELRFMIKGKVLEYKQSKLVLEEKAKVIEGLSELVNTSEVAIANSQEERASAEESLKESLAAISQRFIYLMDYNKELEKLGIIS